jgi:tetratricopeptide (TPR) repeat protein
MARSKKKSKGVKRAEKVRKREHKRREAAERSQILEAKPLLDDDDLDIDDYSDERKVGPFNMPDQRAIEGAMWRQFGMFSPGSDAALQSAQNLIYDAFEKDDPADRVAIAKEALAISPNCADAWVLLAEEAESLSEASRLYEQGVEAGRRAIGKEFDSYVGHFWGVLPTRPYMRARTGLADCLWGSGRRDEAIEHYLDMLRLNPNDNQGLRYILAPRLLESGRAAEAEQLLNRFDDCTAQWLFNKSLLAFRKEGDTGAARKLVANANEANPYVPKYLTGQRMVPVYRPDSYSLGSDEEAQIYAGEASAAWKSTPGAVAWLRKISGVGLGPDVSEPVPPTTSELLKLPQASAECWRLDVRQLPADASLKDDLPLWTIVLISLEADDFVLSDVLESEPSTATVWGAVCNAMTAPQLGEPRRPGRVEFFDERLLRKLERKLEPLGIDAVFSDQADEFIARYEEVAAQMQAPLDDGPLDDLPQVPDEFWQVDCRQMGVWLPNDEGDDVRPWVVLMTCPTDDCIVQHAILTEQPSLDEIWEVVERGMRRPAVGEPRRPGCVQVRSADQRLTLQPRLEAIGVACESGGELDHWDFVYAGLARSMEGQRKTSPFVELPGTTPAQIGSFFQAAAEFHRRAPWRRAPAESVIELKFTDPPAKWDAVVMGQSGLTFGLAMYDDKRSLRQAMSEQPTPEHVLQHSSALSLTFGEQHELAAADLDAAEQFGWPVAAPEAYPVVFRVRPSHGLTSPTSEELRVLEAALRAVPDFVADGPAALTQSVALSDRTVTVELRWGAR